MNVLAALILDNKGELVQGNLAGADLADYYRSNPHG